MSEHVDRRRDAVAAGYARFYPALAVAFWGLSFTEPFNDVIDGDSYSSYGTLFEMSTTAGGGPAQFGLLLLAILWVLLCCTAVGVGPGWLPAGQAGVAAAIAVMLLAKPGTGTPTPQLSDTGRIGLALSIFTVMFGLAHFVHVTVLTRRLGQSE